MSNSEKHLSKFLSLVLRHEPEKAGLTLDSAGWVDVDELLRGCTAAGVPMTRAELESVVANNDKKRLAFSPDGRRIRASQGHSVTVDLEYAPAIPPATLYHGTVDRFLDSIRVTGLNKGERHHVHLSAQPDTAVQVGSRRGRPLVLVIDAGAMHAAGHTFYISANGVWLVDHVPAEFLTVASEPKR